MKVENRAVRLGRIAALFIVMTMVVGLAPRSAFAAQERGGSGGSFSDDEYGFSVSWDESVWESEELEDMYGVGLYGELSFARIDVQESMSDAEDCLTASVELAESSEGIADFRKAPRRYERPESNAPASGLYTFVDAETGDEIVAHYECHELPAADAALEVIVMAYEPDFESQLPAWNDLLSQIDVTGGSSRDDDNGTKGDRGDDNGGLDGNLYSDGNFSLEVGSDWKLRELTEEDQIGEGVEVAIGTTFGYVFTDALRSEFGDCAATYAEGVGSFELISRMKVASSKYDRPETARKAVGDLYTFTLDTDGDKTKMVGYFECREVADEDAALHIFLSAPLSAYEDEMGAWEELLGGITIGDDDDNGKSGRKGGQDEPDEPVNRGGESVVSPNYGIVVEFDDALWTVADQSDDQVDIIQLESELGFGTIVGYGQPFDTQGCFETLIGLKVDDTASNFDVAPKGLARPATNGDAVGELFTYTIQGENGPFDVALYVECRAAAGGDATVGVTLLTVVDVYENALPAFEALLGGVGEANQG